MDAAFWTTRFSRLALPLSIALVSCLGCSDEEQPLPLGSPCSPSDAAACESGVCEAARGGGSSQTICTQACSDTEPCTGGLRCNPETSLCDLACSSNEVLTGATETYLCQSSRFVACSSLTDAECASCGCDVYGGGVCLPVGGCVEPQADGASCTYPQECISGTCYYGTGTCGAALGLGETCYADEDCESANCSNDGDHAMAGVCNMAFGERCDNLSPCNLCASYDVLADGYCIRRFCNPDDPNPCPTGVYTGGTGSRRWECARGADDLYRCYEDCTVEDGYYYNCLEDFFTCHESWSGNYCY